MRILPLYTILLVLAVCFAVCDTKTAYAVNFNEDFDSYSVGTNGQAISFFNASSSNDYVVTDFSAISAPHSLRKINSGASDYNFTNTLDTRFGAFTGFYYTTSGSNNWDVFFNRGLTSTSKAQAFGFSFDDGDIVVYENSGTVLETLETNTPFETWQNITIEWRQGSGVNYEARVRAGALTSAWYETDVYGGATDFKIVFRGVTSISASSYTLMDSLSIVTDNDAIFNPGGDLSDTEYITINEPFPYGTTTATNTVSIDIDYSTPYSLDFRPTTTRTYIIKDAVTLDIEHVYAVTVDANSAESLNVQQDIELTDGSKLLYAGYLTEGGAWYSEVAETFFNVATNTYLMATGLETPLSGSGGQSQINCDLFDVGCQFQKAMQFVFKPSSTALDKFKNIWTLIQNKKPFGYVTATIVQLKTLDSSGVSLFTFGSLPFMDAVFTPLKNYIAGILWFLYFVYWYVRRLKHLDI